MTRKRSIAAVVVNYNYERYIVDALDSLLNQSVSFDEVILVDDGSTDASLKTVQPYSQHVKIISKENGGQLSACLLGASIAESEYIYFLDADDVAKGNLVEEVRVALELEPVKVQFQLQAVSQDLRPTDSVFPSYRENYSSLDMLSDNIVLGFYVCPPTSGNVFRRSTILSFDANRLDLRDFIDGPCALVMPYCGEVVSLNKVLAKYRVHDANHSQWGRVTDRLLLDEIAWFKRRWKQAHDLLPLDSVPFDSVEPVYISERQLMIAALRAERASIHTILGFLAGINSSKILGRQKAALSLWAIAFAVPARKWRLNLVSFRRAPSQRPTLIKRLARGARSRATEYEAL